MIRFRLITGELIWLAHQHIVSVRSNLSGPPGSLVRMSNGNQWAIRDDAIDIINVIDATVGI